MVVSKASVRPWRNVVALALLGLVAVVCVALGRWQLDRAALRRDLQQSITQGRASPVLQLSTETPADALREWRPAQARGHWLHERTVLIENRNQNGQPGYWVASPLRLEGAQAAPAHILVLRGWLPRRFDGQLPTVPTPQGTQHVHGELRSHVPRIYELPALWGKPRQPLFTAATTQAPVVTNLPLDVYAQVHGLHLLPVVLQQLPGSDAEPDGLIRAWEGPSLDADKNMGYAMQWFSFAAIALIAWLGLAWRTWQRRAKKG